MNKKDNLWLTCLKNIVFASLAALGVFFICSIVIAAILNSIDNQAIRYAILYLMVMIMYTVFLYRFHMSNRLDTYAEHNEKFDLKKELTAYIFAEGKIMFVIYGLAAVATEISYYIFTDPTAPNPVLFSSLFCLGPWMRVKIPVLRAIIAFIYSGAVVCLLAILRSRKIHQEKH